MKTKAGKEEREKEMSSDLNLQKQRSDLWYQRWDVRERELQKGFLKAQTSSFKISSGDAYSE